MDGRGGAVIVDSNGPGGWEKISRREYQITRRMRGGHRIYGPGIAQESVCTAAVGSSRKAVTVPGDKCVHRGPHPAHWGHTGEASQPGELSAKGDFQQGLAMLANPFSHAPSGVRTSISLSSSARGKGLRLPPLRDRCSPGNRRREPEFVWLNLCLQSNGRNEQEPSMKMFVGRGLRHRMSLSGPLLL